ncbi:hypothetical protein POTOM_058247 [Populus tomentosa]|uniref:E3 ubiquitin-protein ligase SHPRH second helical domain-containing protein n=1 Tax=Populus tomentosa TaxID=118781 RepID=A0A8X7XWM3_POPTO|nr:hypothetical protein POTOM_058247 [Populus tomentosa]
MDAFQYVLVCYVKGEYNIVTVDHHNFITSFGLKQDCNAFGERENLHTVWWLDALNHAEQNKDSTGELIRKIEEAVSGTLSNSRSSRIASRLRSITGLKYHIQTHLDQLEASRQTLLDRILEIDQTMANPKEEDIERVGHCRICQAIDDGPTCVHCELEGIISESKKRKTGETVMVTFMMPNQSLIIVEMSNGQWNPATDLCGQSVFITKSNPEL